MPETNLHRDNPSRLDRMESMIEHIVNDHIVLEDKLGRLTERVDKLTVNVNTLHDTVILQAKTMDHVITKLAETDARLNRLGAETDARLDRLAALIESDHREFHERLKRLESVQ